MRKEDVLIMLGELALYGIFMLGIIWMYKKAMDKAIDISAKAVFPKGA